MDLKSLFNLSYGMYIISAKKDSQFNGQVANTVFQISSDPPAIAISINKQNLTHQFIEAGKAFTVSILSKDTPLELIGRFGFKSGRDLNKFEGIDYKVTPSGIPYLANHTLAYLEASVNQTVDVFTHTLFIATLTDAVILAPGEPMTYAYYHEVKRGTTPASAPTHIPKNQTKTDSIKYECSLCGYIYDPALGDPESGIKPGTPFEDLPENWVCPVCGAGKDEFIQAT